MSNDPNPSRSDVAGAPTGQPPRWWQLGPKLRALAGAQHDILAPLPSERPRYTAMGSVVLGTALMAMLSMGIALFSVFGKFQLMILPIVLVWGWFILGLDRYLMAIATTPLKAIPRIILAMAFGVIIAEGLLLGLFHTAIEERVAADRTAELDARKTDLLRCNPIPSSNAAPASDAPAINAAPTTPGAAAVPAGCSNGMLLTVKVEQQPDALQRQLDSDKAQRDALQPIVEKDAAEHARLAELARM